MAADFTSLTKTLYDLHEPVDTKSCPLDQLVVENFDEEQIWQELELQNTAVLEHFETAVSQAVLDENLRIVEEDEDEEEEVDDDNIEEELEDEGSENGEGEEVLPKTALADEAGEITDEDSDVDFDVDVFEKQAKEKKTSLGKASKPIGPSSEVDDRFFKLSEMESFLDDMDKREGKGTDEDDDVDYFLDLPSGDEYELDLDDVTFKRQKKQSTVSRVYRLIPIQFLFF